MFYSHLGEYVEAPAYQGVGAVESTSRQITGALTSPIAIGVIGLAGIAGAYLALRRKKSKAAVPVVLGGLAALGLYGYSVTRVHVAASI